MELYVQFNVNKGQRSLCAQLRSGPFVSSGDHQVYGDARGGQTLFCDVGKIENEVHFLFCCPAYDDLREILFTKMLPIYADSFGWMSMKNLSCALGREQYILLY